MSIEIFDVDPEDMRRSALLNRAKSAEVRAIYEAIFSLTPGGAKAAVVEPGDDISKIQNTIKLCADRAEINLQIVVDRIGERVLFTHDPTADAMPRKPASTVAAPRSREDSEAMAERVEQIKDAAVALGRQNGIVTAQETLGKLQANGIVLKVARPSTSVSAVLRNMSEFRHVGTSRFEYLG